MGTGHDIPTAGDCTNCHRKVPSSVLGFSALQLDRESATSEMPNLQTLADDGVFTENPVGSPPYFVLPGSEVTMNAFGYLHTNCGNCHNAFNLVIGNGINLSLEVSMLSVPEETMIYQTNVGVPSVFGTNRVEPGSPDESVLIERMGMRPGGMPPVASNQVDAQGIADVRAWVCELADGVDPCD